MFCSSVHLLSLVLLLTGLCGVLSTESSSSPAPSLRMKSLCYQAKLTPYLSSKTKVADTGSGTATLNIDPVHLTYTRTIVFSDLSFPTKEVHDERAILEGFPTNVQAGSYTQSIAEHPFNAHYFKELELKTVGTFLTFSGEDLLHGTYIPCHQTLSSSALSAPRKQLRGSA